MYFLQKQSVQFNSILDDEISQFKHPQDYQNDVLENQKGSYSLFHKCLELRVLAIKSLLRHGSLQIIHQINPCTTPQFCII